MVQKGSVQLDHICTRPKIVETNDKICIGHLRAFSPWIVMIMMMIYIYICILYVDRDRESVCCFMYDKTYLHTALSKILILMMSDKWCVTFYYLFCDNVSVFCFTNWVIFNPPLIHSSY